MLHPIKAVNQVTEEYKDYLLTEFRAKDPELKKALESEIDKTGFIAGEAFYQVHRPFKVGKKWCDLPLDKKLAGALEKASRSELCYLHQSEAVEYLNGTTDGSLVVTTGTGSGKTECFLASVIDNAIKDATAFKKNGLTAILLYPMNALANDQLLRIGEYLKNAGFEGVVNVAKYDRGTTQQERENLRKNPPHILLTNYMMLEYLLVRPADRDGIFANHRCRFMVLDEVHTYRGTLGSNIALLIRRLKAHLKAARQDENINPAKLPNTVFVGTSATIKSNSDETMTHEEFVRQRNTEISEFFSKLTGTEQSKINVVAEELQGIEVPAEARYSEKLPSDLNFKISDNEELKASLDRLSGAENTKDLEDSSKRCKILWDLNRLLIKKTMSLPEIIIKIIETVPERKNWTKEDVGKEVEAALFVGGALPEEISGSLKLKVHKFFRGGWQFYRCVNPGCGKIYPKGEEICVCGMKTAPLYLCRTCGADYLRFTGDDEPSILRPSNNRADKPEWLFYQPSKFQDSIFDSDEDAADDESQGEEALSSRVGTTMKGKKILSGSFDPASLTFNENTSAGPLKVFLAPARTKCLCCGSTVGSRNIISPVTLGTSAAVKILGEGTIEALAASRLNEDKLNDKERLLVFSDSRQDAAHQARFIKVVSRFDRLRRRLVSIINDNGPLSVQRVVEILSAIAREKRDNPYVPAGGGDFIPPDTLKKIMAYEEAPLLDEISVSAHYRATAINMGLINVYYDQLDTYIDKTAGDLIKKLSINKECLYYMCKTLLDKIRTLGCLNRELLKYHPNNSYYPDYCRASEWERKFKNPQGLPLDDKDMPVGYREKERYPKGIKIYNPWCKEGSKGRKPILQKIYENIIKKMCNADPGESGLIDVINFLINGYYLVKSEVSGFSKKATIIQVNHERVYLSRANENNRFKCNVCGLISYNAQKDYPCPYCYGSLIIFKESEVNSSRHVKRILNTAVTTLEVAEHTAQVSGTEREIIEDEFKSPDKKMNILACSPTLEMGINIGGLDAIILRNIPPRPDNYAQRGGRAGRRQRIGLVLGYVRSTPHDQYFYDHPEEMIAGEVVVPQIALGNKDVIYRHLNAIVFGAASPGLGGKMVDYISVKGDLIDETVNALIKAVDEKKSYAVALAFEAWGNDILQPAGVSEIDLSKELDGLNIKIENIFKRTSRQIKELNVAIDNFCIQLIDEQAANRSKNLIFRILGIQQAGKRETADDRSSGYPLRRFAEFGILPGYEFPDEPASLRLLGDLHEDEQISVARQFGISQYQPKAHVYARNQCWEVIGIDISSPWNPYEKDAGEIFQICSKCGTH